MTVNKDKREIKISDKPTALQLQQQENIRVMVETSQAQSEMIDEPDNWQKLVENSTSNFQMPKINQFYQDRRDDTLYGFLPEQVQRYSIGHEPIPETGLQMGLFDNFQNPYAMYPIFQPLQLFQAPQQDFAFHFDPQADMNIIKAQQLQSLIKNPSDQLKPQIKTNDTVIITIDDLQGVQDSIDNELKPERPTSIMQQADAPASQSIEIGSRRVGKEKIIRRAKVKDDKVKVQEKLSKARDIVVEVNQDTNIIVPTKQNDDDVKDSSPKITETTGSKHSRVKSGVETSVVHNRQLSQVKKDASHNESKENESVKHSIIEIQEKPELSKPEILPNPVVICENDKQQSDSNQKQLPVFIEHQNQNIIIHDTSIISEQQNDTINTEINKAIDNIIDNVVETVKASASIDDNRPDQTTNESNNKIITIVPVAEVQIKQQKKPKDKKKTLKPEIEVNKIETKVQSTIIEIKQEKKPKKNIIVQQQIFKAYEPVEKSNLSLQNVALLPIGLLFLMLSLSCTILFASIIGIQSAIVRIVTLISMMKKTPRLLFFPFLIIILAYPTMIFCTQFTKGLLALLFVVFPQIVEQFSGQENIQVDGYHLYDCIENRSTLQSFTQDLTSVTEQLRFSYKSSLYVQDVVRKNYENRAKYFLSQKFFKNSLVQNTTDYFIRPRPHSLFYFETKFQTLKNKDNKASYYGANYYIEVIDGDLVNVLRGRRSQQGPTQDSSIQPEMMNRRFVIENEVSQIAMFSDKYSNLMRLALPKNTTFFAQKAGDWYDFNNIVLMMPQNAKHPVFVQSISFQDDIEIINDYQMLSVDRPIKLEIIDNNIVNESQFGSLTVKIIPYDMYLDVNGHPNLVHVPLTLLQYISTQPFHSNEAMMIQYYQQLTSNIQKQQLIIYYTSLLNGDYSGTAPSFINKNNNKYEDQLIIIQQALYYLTWRQNTIPTVNILQYLYLGLSRYVQMITTIIAIILYIQPTLQTRITGKLAKIRKLSICFVIIGIILKRWQYVVSLAYVSSMFDITIEFVTIVLVVMKQLRYRRKTMLIGLLYCISFVDKHMISKAISLYGSTNMPFYEYAGVVNITLRIIQLLLILHLLTDKEFIQQWVNKYYGKNIFDGDKVKEIPNAEVADFFLSFVLYLSDHPQFKTLSKKKIQGQLALIIEFVQKMNQEKKHKVIKKIIPHIKALAKPTIQRQIIQVIPTHFQITQHLFMNGISPWHHLAQRFSLLNIANESGYANIDTNIRIVQNDAQQHIVMRRDYINLHMHGLYLPSIMTLQDLRKRLPASFPRYDFRMEWFLSKVITGLYMIPIGAIKLDYGYQFRLKYFSSPSKQYRQRCLTEVSDIANKPIMEQAWVFGDDEFEGDTHVLMWTTLGIDPLSINNQIGKFSHLINLMLYPFIQFEREFKYKQISCSTYLGGLRQIATNDVGTYITQKEPQVGSIIRDDWIPKLSTNEIIFIVSFLYGDYHSAGLLCQSQIQPVSYLDRAQEQLIGAYEAISKQISIRHDDNDYVHQVNEYRLMWLVGSSPLCNASFTQRNMYKFRDTLELVLNKGQQLLNWADKIVLQQPDDVIQQEFLSITEFKKAMLVDQENQTISDYVSLALIKRQQIVILRLIQYTMDTVNHLIFRSQGYIQKVDPLNIEDHQVFMTQDNHFQAKDCIIGCEECALEYFETVSQRKQFLFCDFCDQCQFDICEKIFIPLTKTELYGLQYLNKLQRRQFSTCQCGEDVQAILVQSGIITQEFAKLVINSESNFYGAASQNLKPKIPQFSSRACVARYQRQNKEHTVIFRLKSVAEVLYSVHIIKARLDFMGLSLGFDNEVGISQKFWVQSRIMTQQQQVALLLNILRAKSSHYRILQIYNYQMQCVWTADANGDEEANSCPRDWYYAQLLQ